MGKGRHHGGKIAKKQTADLFAFIARNFYVRNVHHLSDWETAFHELFPERLWYLSERRLCWLSELSNGLIRPNVPGFL